MEGKRLQFIRKQAIDTLELTKGFSPEQRERFSNELKTAEELAGYVLEVTNIEAKPGAVWVKASEFKIEYGPNYYAKWLDGKVKATGHFQESDGTFFWNIPGYVPIGKNEYEHLYILDESAAPKPYDDLYRLVFSNLAKLRARCQNNERMVDMADNIRAIIEDVTNRMLTMPQPDPADCPWQLYQSGSESAVGISQDAHEKEIMMQAFDKVRQIFVGRQWIMDGRGSYPYNDDRYQQEVRYMYDEFDQVVKDTWANIKSKSVDYRKVIIAEYLESAAGREDAVEFAEWAIRNATVTSLYDGWIYGSKRYTTTQLYTIFKQQKEK